MIGNLLGGILIGLLLGILTGMILYMPLLAKYHSSLERAIKTTEDALEILEKKTQG